MKPRVQAPLVLAIDTTHEFGSLALASGDDLVDVPVMRRVGLAFALANARAEVKKVAHYVATASGGAGAVREMVEILLQAMGQWPAILKQYEVD